MDTDEIFASYVTTFGEDHVHKVGIPHFTGRPGHHYFVRRRPTNQDLARMSHHSRNAEVVLIRINHTFIVNVGNPGVANAALFMPQHQDGIESFEWIAHTHPLEQESVYDRVAHGGTSADYEAIARAHTRWGQAETTVVVCQRGRVVTEVIIRPEPPMGRPNIHVVAP